MKKHAVLSLSGGMDSSTLLIHLLAQGYEVTCLSFDYGQKHKIELERAQSLVQYLRTETKKYISHEVIELKGLASLLHSTLVEGGAEVPEGHYEAENMKATVVPNRNKIFSSLIQAVALSVADRNPGDVVEIAMGIHAGDHAIYPDTTLTFRDADYEAFKEGNYDAERVTLQTPFLEIDKKGILEIGQNSCAKLSIAFKEVYSRTMTSYKPIKIIGQWINHRQKYHYNWYADYKSASSVERVEAFLALDLEDPCAYADETGPVKWDVVRAHVEKVLDNGK